MKTIHVSASREYDVQIGTGLLAQAGVLCRSAAPAGRALIVSDDTVWPLYGAALKAALEAADYAADVFVFPHGEPSKNAHTYLALLSALAEKGFTRGDIVVALGGGVTGDLSGFAAATYMRGMRWVQVPTTLLAAVDASVGGKTAIDLPAGKNLAGAFWQPSLVLCDCAALDTLPPAVFTDGCAEVIKYGIIADASLFDALRAPIRPQLEAVIAACVAIKRDVVQSDEFDTGRRKLLNFGHTLGHAVEKRSGFSVSHGRAVAIGMAWAARAAHSRGLCSAGCVREIRALLAQYGLPTETDDDAAALAQTMLADKKRTGGTIDLILPQEIGRCVIVPTPVGELEALVRAGMEAA